MKNKRLAVGLLVLSVVIAVVFYRSLYPPQPALTPANFGRLYIGIEQGEVAAILGPLTHRDVTYREGLVLSDTWESDGCKIVIKFGGPLDDNGFHTAISGELTTDDGQTLKLQPKSPGVLETVRGWLRW